MRLITTIERPSASLPFSACAPSASWLPVSPVAVLPAAAPVALPVVERAQVSSVEILAAERAPVSSVEIVAAERALVAGAHQVSDVYQAPVQAELGQELAIVGGGSYGGGISTTGTNGTTGFKGSNGFDLAMKRRTGDARGVPPRGRPV